MRKILTSLVTISAVSVVVFGATQAYFSDEETSEGNTFTAGAVDLQIDNTSYAVDYVIPTITEPSGAFVKSDDTSWELTDLTDAVFFNFVDLKPGDYGEDTISLHVDSNEAWACVDIELTADDDVSCTDPELGDDNSCDEDNNDPFDGELASQLNFLFWVDDGDNVLETDEQLLTTDPVPASVFEEKQEWKLADSDTGETGLLGASSAEPLQPNTDYYIGKGWCFGTIAAAAAEEGDTDPVTRGVTGFTCDGSQVNNAAQTDMVEGTLTFRAVQYRNNPGFDCNE